MRRFPVRVLAIVLIVAVVGAAGWWGVKSLSSGPKQKRIIAVKPVTRGDIEVVVRGWGQLQATEERDAISGANGVIKDIYFSDGEMVSRDQVLATVDPGSLQISIMKKEVELDSKRILLARAFGVSPEQVESVDPQAALTLKSPISGRVTGLTASSGSSASGVICTIVDDAKLTIRVQLSKPLFDLIKAGTKVDFRPDRFSGAEKGVVTKADPTPIAGESAYYYDVWVEVSNPGLLKAGDEGLLIFYGTEEFQQRAFVTSFGYEETVMSTFSGRVKRVAVSEGATVTAGAPILEYEPGEALLQAMTAQLEFKQLVIDLEDLRSQLQNLNIVSPIDGVATGMNVAIGQTVGKGSIVTRVSNYTNLDLMLRVDEMDIPKVEPGQAADVIVWGREGQQSVTGEVGKVGTMGDPRDGFSSFNITISLVNPGFLRPYMGAEAQIFVSKKADVLLCPIEALYKENEVWYVDLKEGEQRTPVEVQVGIMNDTFAEIISGLDAGQEVVVGYSSDPNDPNGPIFRSGTKMIY